MALNINGTTGISGVDRSVSAPAVTGTDSNTGITFPSADTIKFSTGGVERMSITNSGVSGITTGITMADMWRVTSDVSVDNAYNYLTSNWERTDSGGFGQIGTGMTQSGGVFTFPSTGIYKINFGTYAHDTGSSSINGVHIHTTVDNGSNYSFVTNAYFCIPNITTYTYGCAFTEFIFDVTNVSTHKCRFVVYSAHSVVFEGSTNANATYATFTRLGDT